MVSSEGLRGELTSTAPAPSELIPVPDLETKDVTKAYPRESIIPDNQWASIDVRPLITAEDKERVKLLPYARSRWVEDKLRYAVHMQSSTAKKHNLKMLYYLACLLSFYKFAGGLHKLNATELPAKFPGVPAQILNGMLTTFAEQDGKKFKVTEKTGTKLFAWICVCFLALNGWNIEIERVARELSKEPPK